MTRLFVLLVIFLLAWVGVQRVFKSFLRSPQGRQISALWRLFGNVSGGGQPRGPQASGRSEGRPQSGGRPHAALVRCSSCGTHVPADRAVSSPGGGTEVFCSEECRVGTGQA